LATAVPDVTRRHREADGQVAGGALVDADVQPQPTGPVGVGQRERQRCVPRSRAQHDIADAAADQFVDDDARLDRRGVHQYSVSHGVIGEECQRRGIHRIRLLDEPEVTGVR
jgi:hypothetical protein